MSQLASLLDRISQSAQPPSPRDARKKLFDFRLSKQEYQHRSSATAIVELQKLLWDLAPTVLPNPQQALLLVDALSLSYQLSSASSDSIPELVSELRTIVGKLPKVSAEALSFTLPPLPEEIRAEIAADAKELETCFKAGAYRSCVVLCGRILETALHRRYFDATQHDVLEKSPGIGLGNLIAKMKEKGISLDPALANQIHLINQVRIFSVHKKQEAFTPNKNQAQAIMLYTMDTLGKLFGN